MRKVKFFLKQNLNSLLLMVLGLLLIILAAQVLTGTPGFILFIVGVVSLTLGIFLVLG